MSETETPAVTWAAGTDHVALIRLRRPPNNFFSLDLINGVADALFAIDDDPSCRAAVLCADGKHFCAGADFGPGGRSYTTDDLYGAAVRVFRAKTPFVAAVQGAAIGGGLGLALSADFRVAAPEARFSANFARLGFHQGFGLSVTLPALVGQQKAAELLYTGRRITGEDAAAIGMVDYLVPRDQLIDKAIELAAEIAGSAPLAVRSIRETLRGDLADRVKAATDHEGAEQERLRATADFREGTKAMAERRTPSFTGT
ncbi:MAG: enoyl-CoA hydratase/isomerase family protein [Acidimicrobiia bacterium]|nr:enoyl-CoA hydratase/isomerase family protein [Acidimicrobiia bacterium]